MQVKQGDIFQCHGNFFQVVKATAKTVTVKPIESIGAGNADPYGWERAYLPKPGAFTRSPFFTSDQNRDGKRCAVKDYSAAKDSPQIDVGQYFPAHLWDGETPSVCDTYS